MNLSYPALVIAGAALLLGCSPARKSGTEGPAPCKEVASVQNESPSLLPAGKKFQLVWNDEFNGNSLDESKWFYRTTFWMRKAHWFAGPEDGAVEVKDGKAYLKIVRKANGQLATPQLQTGHLIWDYEHTNKNNIWPLHGIEKPKFVHRYGYYECRCRTQQMKGWWSAFWMQSEMQGTTLDPAYSGIEHDIMESFTPGEIITACFHQGGYGTGQQLSFHSPRDKSSAYIDKEDFHVYGLLWEPDGYTVYIDGQPRGPKVGTEGKEAVSQVPEFILISTEGQGFRDNNCTGDPSPELLKAYEAGDAFVVDYVRVYDIVK